MGSGTIIAKITNTNTSGFYSFIACEQLYQKKGKQQVLLNINLIATIKKIILITVFLGVAIHSNEILICCLKGKDFQEKSTVMTKKISSIPDSY